jgi:hypothetical protein
MAQRVDPPLERRPADRDVAEHLGQPSHRAGRPGPRHLDGGRAAHQQRAAEHFVVVGLVHRHRFAGQHRLVEHRAVGVPQPAIGRHAISGFDPDPIARHDFGARQPHQPPVAQHPRLRAGQRAQMGEGLLRPLLLIEPEAGVQQQDDGNRHRLDGPADRTLVQPHPDVEREGEQQDVDEGTGELAKESSPQRIGRALGQ